MGDDEDDYFALQGGSSGEVTHDEKGMEDTEMGYSSDGSINANMEDLNDIDSLGDDNCEPSGASNSKPQRNGVSQSLRSPKRKSPFTSAVKSKKAKPS